MQPLGLVVTHNVGQVISKEHIILSQLPTETKAVETPFVAAGNKALNVQTCINAGRLKKDIWINQRNRYIEMFSLVADSDQWPLCYLDTCVKSPFLPACVHILQ